MTKFEGKLEFHKRILLLFANSDMEWEDVNEQNEELLETEKKPCSNKSKIVIARRKGKEGNIFSDCYTSRILQGMKVCLRLMKRNNNRR